MADEPTPEQRAALEQLLAGPGVVELTGADTDAPAFQVAAVVRRGHALVHLVKLDEHVFVRNEGAVHVLLTWEGVICGRLPAGTPLELRPEQLGPRPPGLWCPDCSSYLQYVRARQGLQ